MESTTLAEASAETANNTPAAAEQWSGTNLAGDIVERGIQKNHPDVREDLRWWYRYSLDRKMSQADAAGQLGVDGSTYSRVLRGEYKNGHAQVLMPPVKMLSRIRVIRAQEHENALKRNLGRIMTQTVKEIHQVCRKAWQDRIIAFVFGESHIGKTEALQWFRDENNHGATLYVDLQGVTGVQDIYREFARALGISADTPINKLMPRVLSSIDRTNLVIVDEFHHITYAYQKGSSIRMVNALKSIKDRTGCGMVICATDVGRQEIETGRESKLLGQLWRRGTIKLQLPSALRVADVRAVVRAHKLDFPGAPEKGRGADTWKNLRVTAGDFDGLDVCERIAYNFGIKHLFCVLQDGSKIAAAGKRGLQWGDVKEAQGIYDDLSAVKKEV
jgi:DNA transposition AAA+ family ATPase